LQDKNIKSPRIDNIQTVVPEEFFPTKRSLEKIINVVSFSDICLLATEAYHSIKIDSSLCGESFVAISEPNIGEEDPEDANAVSDIMHQSRLGIELVEVDPPDNYFWVICHFGAREIYGNPEEEGGEVELWKVEASFRLYYLLKSLDDITHKDLMGFARVNGPYHAWPYWREFLQNMTMRMGLPPVVLDIKPPPIQKKK
jgi:hypothetical protein